MRVVLAGDMWLWPDDDGDRLVLGLAGDRYPGARNPKPKVIRAGTEMDLEIWHRGCAGCTALQTLEPGRSMDAVITHNHAP